MGDKLKNRVAVVTGSGQGIGRAIALALAAEGAAVVTNNRKPGSTGLSQYGEEFAKKLNEQERQEILKLMGDAETTAQQIRKMGGKAVPFFGDIGDFNTAGKLIKTAIDNFGKIDILVNNASGVGRGFIWELPEEAWNAVFISKIKGLFNCTRHATPYMKEQNWGRIINCSSRAFLGSFEHSSYGAANAAVIGFTRSVARDVSKYHITCNAYTPVAPTRWFYNALARQRIMTAAGAPIRSATAMQNFIDSQGRTEGVAPLIVYLATDEASNISGSVFHAGGTGEYGIYSEPRLKRTINKKKELWTIDELIEQVPKTLLKGYKSPASIDR